MRINAIGKIGISFNVHSWRTDVLLLFWRLKTKPTTKPNQPQMNHFGWVLPVSGFLILGGHYRRNQQLSTWSCLIRWWLEIDKLRGIQKWVIYRSQWISLDHDFLLNNKLQFFLKSNFTRFLSINKTSSFNLFIQFRIVHRSIATIKWNLASFRPQFLRGDSVVLQPPSIATRECYVLVGPFSWHMDFVYKRDTKRKKNHQTRARWTTC